MAKRTYFACKGFLFPTYGYSEESVRHSENEFQLLDDDIVIVSYPKSGTNWMREILGLVWHDGDPSYVQNTIVYERSPWIETVDGLKIALNYPPPRFLATHLPFQLFPKSFQHSQSKIIYVMRNPKDVVTSFYHFAKICDSLEEPRTMEEFLEKFLNGNVTFQIFEGLQYRGGARSILDTQQWADITRTQLLAEYQEKISLLLEQDVKGTHNLERWRQALQRWMHSREHLADIFWEPGNLDLSPHLPKWHILSSALCVGFAFSVMYGSWFDHVKGWMKLKDRPNFFLISYEELQQDLRGSVERICRFLGKELDSHQLDAVVKHASFQTMKDNKMSNFSLLPSIDLSRGKFMRKGVSGDWKNHFTVAQSECFDRVYQEKMQGLGMTFPWD